jgi:hypothetical protein
MTTFHFQLVTCSICEKSSEQQVIASTNGFGSPDLDLRPPEMARSTLFLWLQECPKCGLVSSDLSRAEDGVREILSSTNFASLGRITNTLIGRCLKRSFLEERLGKLGEAAECALWAAWAADDTHDQAAAEYRSKAANLFLSAALIMPVSDDSIVMRTRAIDILRRARKYQEAADLAYTLLANDNLDPTINAVVKFGRKLALAGDCSHHTVQEALSD